MSQALIACYRPPERAAHFNEARRPKGLTLQHLEEIKAKLMAEGPSRVHYDFWQQARQAGRRWHQEAIQEAAFAAGVRGDQILVGSDHGRLWSDEAQGVASDPPPITAARIREIVEMCRAVRNDTDIEPALADHELTRFSTGQLEDLSRMVMGTNALHVRYQVERELARRRTDVPPGNPWF